MNTITTDVEWARGHGTGSWRAYAMINGQATSINCMHNHSRQDLALKCSHKYFTQITAPLAKAELIDIGNGLMEAHWNDDQNRNITRRFRYLLTKETN